LGRFRAFSTSYLVYWIISEFSKNRRPPLEESRFSRGAFSLLGLFACTVLAAYYNDDLSSPDCTVPPTYPESLLRLSSLLLSLFCTNSFCRAVLKFLKARRTTVMLSSVL
jgi:hypothetical protein